MVGCDLRKCRSWARMFCTKGAIADENRKKKKRSGHKGKE